MPDMNKNPLDIPARSEVPIADTWDLSHLFPHEAVWETGLKDFETHAARIESFKGMLGASAEQLADALDFMNESGLLEERLAYYAHLRTSEDAGNSEAQGRWARYLAVSARVSAAGSFVTPEIQAIPDDRMKAWLKTDRLIPYQILLRKILRHKPHVLSDAEERLLAMQSEFAGVPRQAFGALTDVDMRFGKIKGPDGERPLTHSTYAEFMQHPDREVRRTAYTQYIAEFDQHKNTLAALYSGSVQRDVYLARVRRHPSALAMSLFSDDVPIEVYDRLIDAVHAHLPTLHRYYGIRRRALGVDPLRLYDLRVPLVPAVTWRHTYDEAVERVVSSLTLMGDEYTQALRAGLSGRWVDRYENKGKQSGAFSAGSFTGHPYILMNYKDEVLNDLFTLTHEAGHSMHSWYSARHQPFQHYNYTIFVAEVASTFNEQALADHLIGETSDPHVRTYLINKQVDDILATLFRQTMFAEFERRTHAMVEANQPLTVDSLQAEYRTLLTQYGGPAIPLEEHSGLEGLRIPHFYSAFYVYKYATGLSAAMALYEQVSKGGPRERDRYIDFLKSGGSKYPLDQLAEAGVDMRSATPVETALSRFASLVDELESALG